MEMVEDASGMDQDVYFHMDYEYEDWEFVVLVGQFDLAKYYMDFVLEDSFEHEPGEDLVEVVKMIEKAVAEFEG